MKNGEEENKEKLKNLSFLLPFIYNINARVHISLNVEIINKVEAKENLNHTCDFFFPTCYFTQVVLSVPETTFILCA